MESTCYTRGVSTRFPRSLCAFAFLAVATYAYGWDVAEFARMARTNPVMALQGVELSSYENSLAERYRSTEEIAIHYPEDVREVIMRALVPPYLIALADTERHRRLLISEPTHMRALLYALSLERTLRLRIEDAEFVASAIDEHVALRDMAFFDGSTDGATYTAALRDIAAQSGAARSRARAHVLCLMRLLVCPDRFAIEPVAPFSRSITPGDVAALSIVTDLHSVLTDYSHTESRLLLMRSECAFTEETPTAVWYRTHEGRIRSQIPLPDILIIDYTDAPRTMATSSENAHRERGVSPSVHTWFREQGVQYLYQPLGNHYFCTASGYDAATVSRMLGVADALVTQDTSRWGDTGGPEPFVLDESDVAQTVQDLSASDTDEARDIVTLWRAGTYRFDETIRALTEHDAYVRFALQHGDSIPLGTLLMMRSYPSVLFMPFNATISETPSRFRKDDSRFGMRQFGLRTYAELSRTADERVLLEGLKKGFRAVDDLIRQSR